MWPLPYNGIVEIVSGEVGGCLDAVTNHGSVPRCYGMQAPSLCPHNLAAAVARLLVQVATDVAWYLASSEQRNTAIGVGVIVEAKNGQS